MESLESDIDEFGAVILIFCSYHRRDMDEVVLRTPLERVERLSDELDRVPYRKPTADLGLLKKLPNEILVKILVDLDLVSYRHFRGVNRQARNFATPLKQYQVITEHGLQLIDQLERTHTADQITVQGMYDLLCTPHCTLCGEFAAFVFLPTPMRCCFECINTSKHLRVSVPSDFGRAIGMTEKRLKRLVPMMKPERTRAIDRYGGRGKLPMLLVPEALAIATLSKLGVFQKDAHQVLHRANDHRKYSCMVSTAVPWFNPKTNTSETGVSCKGCQYLHEADGLPIMSPRYRHDRVFTFDGFLAHFRSCEGAQQLWRRSERGTRIVKLSTWLAFRGQPFWDKSVGRLPLGHENAVEFNP